MELDRLIGPRPLPDLREFTIGIAGESVRTIISVTSWPYFIGENCQPITLRTLREPGFKPNIAVEANLAGTQRITCVYNPYTDKICYYYITDDHKVMTIRRAVDLYRQMVDWIMNNLPFGRPVF